MNKRCREDEPGTTSNKSSQWSERELNSWSPDIKSGALSTQPRCLLDIRIIRITNNCKHASHERASYFPNVSFIIFFWWNLNLINLLHCTFSCFTNPLRKHHRLFRIKLNFALTVFLTAQVVQKSHRPRTLFDLMIGTLKEKKKLKMIV